jgi:signal transduction histidine kinase
VLARCTIFQKFVLGIVMLFSIVVALSVSGILSVSSYRQLVRTVSDRAAELPKAEELTRSVDNLVYIYSGLRKWRDKTDRHRYDMPGSSEQFNLQFMEVVNALVAYREQLEQVEPNQTGIADNRDEWETVREIDRKLAIIRDVKDDEDWIVNLGEFDPLEEPLEELRELAAQLPGHLQTRMQHLKGNVRGQYHTLIGLTVSTSILSALLLALLVKQSYAWVFRPLRELIEGSRQVAGGDFKYRIQLNTNDEMAELAGALNAMTDRFQQIRDDLDQQVKQRTKEVVRSEQLASVGYLAAGVAHEINNPLASIAWSAEALESRLHEILYGDGDAEEPAQGDHLDVLRRYLRRIQEEAFRCKGITERLLDFSRIGDVERQQANLEELVQDVIEMVKHLGRYRNKRIEFDSTTPVTAMVNPQEIKQVVLNLITNALDSVEPNGQVTVEVRKSGEYAELRVADNGCGMSEDVLEHIFEPFFTRRRDGQGTGLGLSIAWRIVADHGGRLHAHSDGPQCGSTFHVTLPLVAHKQFNEDRSQAA